LVSQFISKKLINVGGDRFENYGDASTEEHAKNMARRIARKAGRGIEFVIRAGKRPSQNQRPPIFL